MLANKKNTSRYALPCVAPIRRAHCRFHADVHKANSVGHTALHVASINGHTDVMEVLLEYGADLDARTLQGYTPLYVAFGAKQLAAARLLLAAGASIGQRNDTHTSLVGLAAGR